jgi:hypothetical protein
MTLFLMTNNVKTFCITALIIMALGKTKLSITTFGNMTMSKMIAYGHPA